MKPRLFCLWLLLSAAVGLFAYDFQYGDLRYTITSDNTVAVAFQGSSARLSSVSIPIFVNYNDKTYRVTSIEKSAFSRCSGLTSITIPNSVTSIGESAFSRCSGLTSITIPNSVTSIGEFAFSRCSGLTSITIPNSVTSIGEFAFNDCSGLSSITIPNSVTSIEGYTFGGCTGLISITIPNSVTSIGSSAFDGCSGLTSITIPNSVTSIGSFAFDGCSGLTSITISNSVTSIRKNAFNGCSGLTSITIPNSVMSIGESAFADCSLQIVTFISDTPPQCAWNSFGNLSGVTIHIPCWSEEKYRAALGDHDFVEPSYSDYRLIVQSRNSNTGSASIVEKPTCRNIGVIKAVSNHGYHFTQWSDGNTDNPRTVTLTCDTTLTAEFAISLYGQCGNSLYWQYDNRTLTISGTGSMYDYSTDNSPWLLFCDTIETLVIEQGCTHIGNNAFYGLNSVTKIDLPGTITSIGESAFANCSKLGSVYLPATLATISENAFAGCRRLYDIYCYAIEPPIADNGSFANYNVNLYVPCDNLRDYQMDAVFGSFKYIQCMGAENTNTSDSITITPSSNDAVFVWRADDAADTYTLQITKDDEVFCTLVFNANGQLCSSAFAPSRNGHPAARAAEQTATGFRFTVTGLSKQTHYAFEMKVKDKNDQLLQTYTGEFDTTADTPSDVGNVSSEQNTIRKVVRDGQVLIIRGDKTYTATGIEVE